MISSKAVAADGYIREPKISQWIQLIMWKGMLAIPKLEVLFATLFSIKLAPPELSGCLVKSNYSDEEAK